MSNGMVWQGLNLRGRWDTGGACQFGGPCGHVKHRHFLPAQSTTQHPARVEVGQVWELDGCGRYTLTRYDGARDEWLAKKDGQSETRFANASDFNRTDLLRLVSPAPAPDRCKAPECLRPNWCGFKHGDRADPRLKAWTEDNYVNGVVVRRDGKPHRYCSDSCAAKPQAPDRSGPPEGYVKCRKCSGARFHPGGLDHCCACHVRIHGHAATNERSAPDWTPPIGVPAGPTELINQIERDTKRAFEAVGLERYKPAPPANRPGTASRNCDCGASEGELHRAGCAKFKAATPANNAVNAVGPVQRMGNCASCAAADSPLRVTKAYGREPLCTRCYLEDERRGKWPHGTGKPLPDDAPERIDRRLRRDAGVEDSCLEDA